MSLPTTPLRLRVDAEIESARRADAQGRFDTALHHLERAHVLGQRSTVQHVRVHALMLRRALRHRMIGEATAQAWRIAAAALFTPLGLVPAGNPGTARVSGLRSRPIPDDLRRPIDADDRARTRTISIARAVAALTVLAVCAALAGCMTPPANLDLSRDKLSENGRYRVAIAAPTPAPAINQLHAWTVRLTSVDGRPVTDGRFTVAGGMPQHGHGYPTKPRVTREVEAGTYLLEGMKFSMTGWWDLKLGIQGADGPDAVTFDIVVDAGPR
ncbi:MAG TPA: DUF3703 domain-containing protein [Burkholderiaceae bacterium]|nr:DUF3703 domain-containing protein [Burkholderiaceae bacterium]